MSRILVVEDDEAMSIALRDGLSFEGYEVEIVRDGEAGYLAATETRPDLIILDVMLPKKSGLDVCRQLRSKDVDVPILLLTARGQEIDRVVGLRTGADDYVTKPFSFMELTARIEAILRRSGRGTDSDLLEFGDVSLNFRNFEATKDGKALDLSPLEFRLIRYLANRANQVISRTELLDKVWGYDSTAFSRTVDTHIARIRQKIEETPSHPRHLVTVHRMGYKFIA